MHDLLVKQLFVDFRSKGFDTLVMLLGLSQEGELALVALDGDELASFVVFPFNEVALAQKFAS